jgi:hypothetical protein
MATVLREVNPATANGHVAHLARPDKRYCQRECEYPKEQERQTPTSLPAETTQYFRPSWQDGLSVYPWRQGFSCSA